MQRYLERKGLHVLRFWGNDVFVNLEAILNIIVDRTLTPTPLVWTGYIGNRCSGTWVTPLRQVSAGVSMPWSERSVMALREEFVVLAQQSKDSLSELCRRFGISRKTGYKWLNRAQEGLADRPRRPHHSPGRTPAAIEEALLHVRDTHPDWGARKLKRFLQNTGMRHLPSVSTVTAILHRHGRISPAASAAATHWQRFEHAAPNMLWQMDFKGHFALASGRCHPLTVLDDHSRFNLVLHACPGETFEDVQPQLIAGFRRYGLPWRISCDNGAPWGTMMREDRLTRLGAWLIRLGVHLTHARPGHPQTNGKDERFHRTLNAGVLTRGTFADLLHAQRAFDTFRTVYNQERPHDALQLDVPINRYRPSERPYPEVLPPVEYTGNDPIRKVDSNGNIYFRGTRYRISKALRGQPVALRHEPEQDGLMTVFYCDHPVRQIDLKDPSLED
jgi:transposase InsO family protein